MIFQQIIDPGTRQRRYTVVFNEVEVALLEFDRIDLAILKECDGSGSIADKLLALQMIAKRVEEKEKTYAALLEATEDA